MTDTIELNAEQRQDTGKGASRRLRRHSDQVPAILYGGTKAPQLLAFAHKDLTKLFENEALFSSILTLNIGKKKEQVVLKSLQRHPSKPKILHLDLQRVSRHEEITMNVPFRFIGEEEAPGVKEGGVITHNMTDIEIKCLPNDLPEFIEINVSQLNMDDVIHIKDIQLPKGVELKTELTEATQDSPVVSIHPSRVEQEIEEEVSAAAEEKAEAESKTEPEATTEEEKS